MEFSRNWLAEYVELPPTVEELAERLTAAGLAVEGVEERGDDVLLDVDVTTNRPDCMCHLGLAREVAVLCGRPLAPPADALDASGDDAAGFAGVEIADPDCRRYSARVVRGVTVGPSPAWLVERLEAIGQRPINNVVDITNFVLWETGQPIHAFDLEKLSGRRIVVRAAAAGEKLETLDGETRELTPEVLVIADAERPVALAGIMGGLDSEVSATTSDVLIESAHFDPGRVRQGAKLVGLHTDASHRFERGADPEATLAAADRVAALVAEIAGGQVAAELADPRAASLPELAGTLSRPELERFAGVAYEAAAIERILSGLGFEWRPEGDAYRVTVPPWRHYDFADRKPVGDVYAADLYEEILRIDGLDRIPAALPALGAPDPGSSAEHRLRERVRHYLASCGLAEAVNFAFQERATLDAYPGLGAEGEPIVLANPISERLEVMRRSLVPNLVESARFNQRRGAASVRLFEIGRVFVGGETGEADAVAVVAGGGSRTPWDREIDFDFFDLKGMFEGLAGAFGLGLESRAAELPGLVPGSSCELVTGGGRVAGYLGRLDDADLPYPVFAGELALEPLTGAPGHAAVRAPSRFPGIAVDLTLTHALEVSWSDIDAALAALDEAELVDYGLKDRYEGEGVPPGAVNTTIHFLYNAEDRSLTQEQVNESHERVRAELTRRFGW